MLVGKLRVAHSEGVRDERGHHAKRGVGFGPIILTKPGKDKIFCFVVTFANPMKVIG